jgi:hypothetical protein
MEEKKIHFSMFSHHEPDREHIVVHLDGESYGERCFVVIIYDYITGKLQWMFNGNEKATDSEIIEAFIYSVDMYNLIPYNLGYMYNGKLINFRKEDYIKPQFNCIKIGKELMEIFSYKTKDKVIKDKVIVKCPNCGHEFDMNEYFCWTPDEDGDPTIESLYCPKCNIGTEPLFSCDRCPNVLKCELEEECAPCMSVDFDDFVIVDQ